MGYVVHVRETAQRPGRAEAGAEIGKIGVEVEPETAVATLPTSPPVHPTAASTVPVPELPARPWSNADDILARAVLRAVGVAPGDSFELLFATWSRLALPAPAELRDPAAKRALWPRLRRLRRGREPR